MSDWHEEFVTLVQNESPIQCQTARPATNLKLDNSAVGLETSVFCVCSRVRPIMEHESAEKGENFKCTLPGKRSASGAIPYTEDMTILVPKVRFRIGVRMRMLCMHIHKCSERPQTYQRCPCRDNRSLRHRTSSSIMHSVRAPRVLMKQYLKQWGDRSLPERSQG